VSWLILTRLKCSARSPRARNVVSVDIHATLQTAQANYDSLLPAASRIFLGRLSLVVRGEDPSFLYTEMDIRVRVLKPWHARCLVGCDDEMVSSILGGVQTARKGSLEVSWRHSSRLRWRQVLTGTRPTMSETIRRRDSQESSRDIGEWMSSSSWRALIAGEG
jgi:hypothetical protein